ncbi:hypothetical protein OH77DRAFT_1425544 [Trametes cingulata]|nr:hypothetical protein OH77DRAFT_1425544 [Trametes cingulata]
MAPEVIAATHSEWMRMVAQERQRAAHLAALANSLPKLTEGDLATLGESDSTCPICLNSLLALLSEEEMALAMDTPAHPVEELGVTRLEQTCGHIFCRKDIRNWLNGGHTTCPTCRRPFIAPLPGDDAHARERNLGFPGIMFSPQLSDGTQVGPIGLMELSALARFPRNDYAEHEQSGASSGDGGGSPEGDPHEQEHEHEDRHLDYDDDRSAYSAMYS